MKQFGYKFIDFNDFITEMDLDKNRDFFNESHLNSSGAVKFTKYLSRFLNEDTPINVYE